MQTLTREQKRAIAALRTIPGYQLLIDKVIKSKWEQSLAQLKLASESERIIDTAHKFRDWDEMIDILERVPRELGEELKAEGDEIYG